MESLGPTLTSSVQSTKRLFTKPHDPGKLRVPEPEKIEHFLFPICFKPHTQVLWHLGLRWHCDKFKLITTKKSLVYFHLNLSVRLRWSLQHRPWNSISWGPLSFSTPQMTLTEKSWNNNRCLSKQEVVIRNNISWAPTMWQQAWYFTYISPFSFYSNSVRSNNLNDLMTRPTLKEISQGLTKICALPSSPFVFEVHRPRE